VKFLENTSIDFVGLRKWGYGMSVAMMLITTASLVWHKGFRLGIEFTGGSMIQVKFGNPVGLEDIRKILTQTQVGNPDLQSLVSQNSVIIRLKESPTKELAERIVDALQAGFPGNKVTLERSDIVGPVVGRYLLRQALLALVCSLAGIMIYVGFRFRNMVWGTAGVLALLHDVIAAAGVISLLNREMTLTIIAALLTIAGYSINDTIVVFDRMREKIRLRKKEPLEMLINKSINETLTRTVNTSMTVILALLSLFFFGGQVIHDFSLALLFGVLVGTYSSIGMAAPMVYEWYTHKARMQAQR
jgi:preprotein translocase subunit SecF